MLAGFQTFWSDFFKWIFRLEEPEGGLGSVVGVSKVGGDKTIILRFFGVLMRGTLKPRIWNSGITE